jgi:hypothetical protein
MTSPSPAGLITRQQRLEAILAQPGFEGLKAIFERLGCDREVLGARIQIVGTYEQLLAELGYKLVLTKQIHVQDSYSRVGPEGGIKAVVPYYDIPTQRSLPTLVNFDGTVTTTSNAAAFFEGLLADLRKQLSSLV